PGSTNPAISGPGGFQKLGAGILTVADTANTYTGQTRVSAGTLSFTHDNNLGVGGDLVLDGGSLSLNGTGTTWANSRTDYLNARGTLALGDNNAALSGIVTGTGTSASSLTLTATTTNGNGLLTLSGNNSFGEALLLSSGILLATSNTALGLNSASVTVAT